MADDIAHLHAEVLRLRSERWAALNALISLKRRHLEAITDLRLAVLKACPVKHGDVFEAKGEKYLIVSTWLDYDRQAVTGCGQRWLKSTKTWSTNRLTYDIVLQDVREALGMEPRPPLYPGELQEDRESDAIKGLLEVPK